MDEKQNQELKTTQDITSTEEEVHLADNSKTDSRTTETSAQSKSESTNETTFVKSETRGSARYQKVTSLSGRDNARDLGRVRFRRKSTGGLGSKRQRFEKKKLDGEVDNFDSQVIEVKRVTRVVKGGKRMRFAALVVVGNKQGQVGFGFKKGLDYQESVAKATRKAKENLIKIELNEDNSISFPITVKHKSVVVYLKPAKTGTGLISGGFLRPVLELAGIQNVYSKILGSRNKIAGVQAAIKALQAYNK
jgi:small subunit ribosomal protein S5